MADLSDLHALTVRRLADEAVKKVLGRNAFTSKLALLKNPMEVEILDWILYQAVENGYEQALKENGLKR